LFIVNNHDIFGRGQNLTRSSFIKLRPSNNSG
jgi:hypothetical protein